MDKKEFLESEKLNFAEQMDPEMVAQNQDVIRPSELTKEIEDMVASDREVLEKETEKETPAGLLQEYTELDLEISKVIIEQQEFYKKNKEMFAKYEEFADKISDFREKQQEVTESLKRVMRETNSTEEIGIRFRAKYTAPYTKKKFNTKQFYEDYTEDTAMYKKYVETTNVSDSVKITEVKNK